MVVEDGFFHADFIRQNFMETTTGGCLFENLKNLMLCQLIRVGKCIGVFGCHPNSTPRQWRFLEGGFQAAQGTMKRSTSHLNIAKKF